MIAKKEVSKMVFTLKHNTVNISKGTPDTDMRLAPFERAENFLWNDVIKIVGSWWGVHLQSTFLFLHHYLYIITLTLQYHTMNISGGIPDVDLGLAPLERAENLL